MKFEEGCVNDYQCIVDMLQTGRRKDYIRDFLIRRASLKAPTRFCYENYIQPSGTAVFRFVLAFAIIVACGIGLMELHPYVNSFKPLGYVGTLLSLILSIMLVCFNLVVIPMFGDDYRKRIFGIIGYSEAGLMLLCGIIVRYKDIFVWYVFNWFLIVCFIDIFFITCLVLILMERKSIYKIEKDACCVGYVRLINEYYSDRGRRYSCRISPIFEYETSQGTVKSCYDEFSRAWNSKVPLGPVKIHVSDQDVYMVQPEMGFRVFVFAVFVALFTAGAISAFRAFGMI